MQHAALSIVKNIWGTLTVFWDLSLILMVWLMGGVMTLLTVTLLVGGVYWLLLG